MKIIINILLLVQLIGSTVGACAIISSDWPIAALVFATVTGTFWLSMSIRNKIGDIPKEASCVLSNSVGVSEVPEKLVIPTEGAESGKKHTSMGD